MKVTTVVGCLKLISSDRKVVISATEVGGILLEHPQAKAQPKMPYSPLFIPDGSDKVWAQMSVLEENSVSHRGKAFRLARDFLIQY